MENLRLLQIAEKLIPGGIKVKLHSGDKYICPFCNFRFKNLSPIGQDFKILKEKQVIGAGLRRAGCYNCGSTDRERLVYLYLKYVLKIEQTKDSNILHFAPEPNLSAKLRELNFKNYICGDLFMKGYEYPDFVENMDVLNIQYENNFFDIVICNHLLEHVEDDITAMKEIFRVLKPGRAAILQVPISKNSEKTIENKNIVSKKEREIHFGQSDHLRIYGQDYPKRLSSVGFKVERKNISLPYELYGLNPEENLFIAVKDLSQPV